MARRRRRPPRPGGPKRKKKRGPRPQPAGPVIPDTPVAKLEEKTRKDILRIIQLRGQGSPLTESERLLDRILEQHPEHLPAFADADSYVPTGDPDSPYVHVGLHRIVEERVVTRQIPRLDSTIPWHDAVHARLERVAEELFPSEEEEAAEEEAV